MMLERDIRLVRLTGARYHAAMISCADSVEIVRRAKAGRPAGHLRRLDQQPRPERERRRRLPHLLQALAAAAPRGRPPGPDRGAGRRRHRRHRVRPQPAGRRDEAPALRGGRRRGGRPRDPARGGPAPRPYRRRGAAARCCAALSAKPADDPRPARRDGSRSARRPTSSCSIPTRPTCSTSGP